MLGHVERSHLNGINDKQFEMSAGRRWTEKGAACQNGVGFKPIGILDCLLSDGER